MKVYWLGQTEVDVPTEDDWLSTRETACLETMRFSKRRSDWRLGRWTAKRAVSIYQNAPSGPRSFACIEVRPAASGAPEIFLADQPLAVTISLSHRSGAAMCAIAPPRTELGCDLEAIESRSEGFVADYFADDEQALIAGASAADRFRLVALLWSAKESALKALREGLRLDTRSVIVSLLEGFPNSARDEDAADSILHHRLNWLPLEVRCNSGQVFRGWWGQKGNLLQTLVAAPAPARPVPLQP